MKKYEIRHTMFRVTTPGTPGLTPTLPPATCPTCGCRLSIYRSLGDNTCLPCQTKARA